MNGIKKSVTILFFTIGFVGFSSAEIYSEHYQSLDHVVRNVGNSDKVELVEFFWYGCPHCYVAEPIMEHVVKKLPEGATFVRIPAANNPRWEIEAAVYYLMQSKGILAKAHKLIFNAIHGQGRELRKSVGRSPEGYQEFLNRYFSIEKEEFERHFNSFAVKSKINRAKKLAIEYDVRSVPSIYVGGKYRIINVKSSKSEEVADTILGLLEKEIKLRN